MDYEKLKYRADRHYRFGGNLIRRHANENRKPFGREIGIAVRMVLAFFSQRPNVLTLTRKIDSFEDDAPHRIPRPADAGLNGAQRMIHAGEDANYFYSPYDSVNDPNTDALRFETHLGENAPRLPKD